MAVRAVVIALLVAGCAAGGASPGPTAAPAPVVTAEVVRQSLTVTDQHAGRLGYGQARPVVAGRDGTVTAVPAAGEVVGRGAVLLELDGLATRLLFGDRPAWRRLAVAELASDDGPDVRQLHDNLAALGFAARAELPDQRFDWRTREAVRAWQGALGRPPTGVLELGDVAFLPGDVRIAQVLAPLGTRVAAGEVVLTVTATVPVVTVALDAAARGTMTEGLAVVVALPDRSRVDAVVRAIARVATAPADGEGVPTVDVEIALPGAPGLDAAPVVVEVQRVLATDALTVPVGALLALTGTGYAVERVREGGTPELVTVQPGVFADGLVAVTGALAAGDRVVVPG